MYDWSHMYVHDGAADVEFGLCMHFMQKHSKRGTSYAELGMYLKEFKHPKSAPCLDHLFKDEKNRNNYKNKSFSSTGSEFLTLTPILHRYFDKIVKPRGEHIDVVDSMLAVLSVVMLLMTLKTGLVTPEALGEVILAHLTLFLVAWGEGYDRNTIIAFTCRQCSHTLVSFLQLLLTRGSIGLSLDTVETRKTSKTGTCQQLKTSLAIRYGSWACHLCKRLRV